MIVLLGAFWSLWGAFWLRRVELVRENQGVVRRLGLQWAREGLGPSVAARGERDGVAIEVEWRRTVWGSRVRTRVGPERGGVELLERLERAAEAG